MIPPAHPLLPPIVARYPVTTVWLCATYAAAAASALGML